MYRCILPTHAAIYRKKLLRGLPRLMNGCQLACPHAKMASVTGGPGKCEGWLLSRVVSLTVRYSVAMAELAPVAEGAVACLPLTTNSVFRRACISTITSIPVVAWRRTLRDYVSVQRLDLLCHRDLCLCQVGQVHNHQVVLQ